MHCNDFFRRHGIAVLTNRELFDFAVDPTVTDDNVDEVLEALKEQAAARPLERTAEDEASPWCSSSPSPSPSQQLRPNSNPQSPFLPLSPLCPTLSALFTALQFHPQPYLSRPLALSPPSNLFLLPAPPFRPI